MQLPEIPEFGFNAVMKIYETRRLMLQRVVDERFRGRSSYLAEAVGRDAPTVSMILRGKRVFGETVARDIERRLGLSELYLDGVGTEELALARLIAQLSPERKVRMRHYLEAEVAMERHEAAAAGATPLKDHNLVAGDTPAPS